MTTLNTTPRQAVNKTGIKHPQRVTLTELLAALRTGGEISALTEFNPPRIWTGTPSQLQGELNRDPRRALYYAVNPLGCVPDHGRGKKKDYTRLAALWVDADYKLTGWKPGEEPEGAQDLLADLRNRLETLLGAPAGFITYSGNGEHWIWPLKPSEQARHEHREKDCPLCDGILNPWHLVVNQQAAKLGLDTPDNVHDIPRVLRAPGSYNLKQKPGRETFTLRADRLQYVDIADAKRAINTATKPANKQPATRPPADADYWEPNSRQEPCNYVQRMVNAWPSDAPATGRHNWLISQAYRLTAAEQLGCLGSEVRQAENTLENAFMNAIAGDRQPSPPDEFARALADARTKTRGKSDSELRAELGGHNHGLGIDYDLTAPTPPVAGKQGQAPGKAGKEKTKRLVGRLIPASSVEMKPTYWLWGSKADGSDFDITPAMVPQGELTFITGREGTGKSQAAIWIAAQVTNGTLPGCYEGKPRNIIYVATEDNQEKTLKPRLVAAGADMARVSFYAVSFDGQDIPLSLASADQTRELIETAKAENVALIVFDPLMSAMGGARIDTHKEAEVRAVLEPLIHELQAGDLTALAISHQNKTGTTDLANGMVGSGAFKNLARQIIGFVVKDPDNENEPKIRLASVVKSNLGKIPEGGLTYEIRETQLRNKRNQVINTSCLEWTGTSPLTVSELMGRERDSEIPDAEAWTVAYLESAGGEALFADLKKAGRANGFSDEQLKNVRKRRKSYPRIKYKRTREAPPKSVWYLDTAEENPAGSQPENDPARPKTAYNTRSTQQGQAGSPDPARPSCNDQVKHPDLFQQGQNPHGTTPLKTDNQQAA